MLLPLLERHGLQGSTQALLYFSAGGDGRVVDSGRTVVTGRWGGEAGRRSTNPAADHCDGKQ